MKDHVLLVATIIVSLASSTLAADTAYVIDKLLVGVHENQDLNSTIVKVLPTGTKLDVARREGELARVTDPDGTVGWVDAAYLMDSPPAEVRAKALLEENAALLKRLNGTTGAAPSPVTGAERESFMKENTELKRKLSAEKLKVSELQSKVGGLETDLKERSSTPADTLIAEIESKNRDLAEKLEKEIENNQRHANQNFDSPTVISGSLSKAVLGGIIGLLLAAFAAGIYVMDYLNRRRHGGFRV